MKQSLLFALTLALASSYAGAADTPAAPTPPIESLFDDPVVARAKGVEIKRSHVEEAFTAYRARMAERNQPVTESQRPLMEKQVLEGLIVTKVLAQRSTAEDKIKGKERAESMISNYRTNAGSDDALRRQLKIRGTTVEKFTRDLIEEETARQVMDRELKSKITISDAQIKDFYENGVDALVKIMQEQLERLAKDQDTTPLQLSATKKRIDDIKQSNIAKLQLPERVRVSHILFAAHDRQTELPLPEDEKKKKLQLAQQVLTRARAGENWTNLVQQYSEDRNLEKTRGEYLVGRNDPFVEEFKAASFSLTNNQISDIVTTIFGYHIIKQHERIPAKKVEMEKAADEIRRALTEQEFERLMPEFLDQVKKEVGVEILDPKYRFAPTARELVKPSGG